MIDQLVNECANFHLECEAPQVVALPSRILDVQSSADANAIFPLVSGGRNGKYAALSYCWGGQQDVVAKEDTWEELMKGIPLSVLPKTIQDAVVVTRRLGLQYLWVDALCIKQDSKEDWGLESSKMADIYGNAAVTIAAAGGSDCNTGCFLRHLDNRKPDTFLIDLPNGEEGCISIRVQNDYTSSEDPLHTRAWGLQERLLSPRLLTFSTGIVTWQCQAKVGMRGIGSVRLPSLFFQRPSVVRRWNWQAGVSDSATLHKVWAQISLDFSRRSITYETDILPALSGLARRFQEVTGDMYLAGLWKETLRRSLLWQSSHDGKGVRPATYVAPTWSWLSLRGPILHRSSTQNDKLPIHIEIVDAETTLASLDPTGPVLGGKITLRGRVREARLKGRDLWGIGAEAGCAGFVILDTSPESVGALGGSTWCLWILKSEGLLLKSSGANFQRVGIFVLDKTPNDHGKAGKKDSCDDEKAAEEWFKDGEVWTMTLV